MDDPGLRAQVFDDHSDALARRDRVPAARCRQEASVLGSLRASSTAWIERWRDRSRCPLRRDRVRVYPGTRSALALALFRSCSFRAAARPARSRSRCGATALRWRRSSARLPRSRRRRLVRRAAGRLRRRPAVRERDPPPASATDGLDHACCPWLLDAGEPSLPCETGRGRRGLRVHRGNHDAESKWIRLVGRTGLEPIPAFPATGNVLAIEIFGSTRPSSDRPAHGPPSPTHFGLARTLLVLHGGDRESRRIPPQIRYEAFGGV